MSCGAPESSDDSGCSSDEERFLAALLLLRSTDADSAERLRRMLERALEEACRPEKRARENEEGENPADEEVPRISIPEEGSLDGVFCKVCNETKLGPMILLECQDCQATYHPLCHCPPVTEVDVYDPRLVWRCSECSGRTDVNNVSRDDDIPDSSGASSGKRLEIFGKFHRVRSVPPTPPTPTPPSSSLKPRRRIGLKRSVR